MNRMLRAPYCLRHRYPPKVFPVTVESVLLGVDCGNTWGDQKLAAGRVCLILIPPGIVANRASLGAPDMSLELRAH